MTQRFTASIVPETSRLRGTLPKHSTFKMPKFNNKVEMARHSHLFLLYWICTQSGHHNDILNQTLNFVIPNIPILNTVRLTYQQGYDAMKIIKKYINKHNLGKNAQECTQENKLLMNKPDKSPLWAFIAQSSNTLHVSIWFKWTKYG